jgi:hypothetical protein
MTALAGRYLSGDRLNTEESKLKNPPFEFNSIGSARIHRLTFSDLQLYGCDLSAMIEWAEKYDHPILDEIVTEKNVVNKELGRRIAFSGKR